VIAREIRDDWSKQGTGVNYAAKPYLQAMGQMTTVNENYGCDSGKSVVAYFLSNASAWRGEVARRVKKELNALLR
jgi:hypothetical protein